MADQDSIPHLPQTELTREEKIYLAEYEKAQQMTIHYDVMNMQFSGIVTAGVFVLWGLVFQARIDQTPIIKVPSLIILI